MAKGLQPRSLAAGFGVYFLVIAFIAWGYAQSQGLWFEKEITRWVYTTYMLVAAIFLVGLGGLRVAESRLRRAAPAPPRGDGRQGPRGSGHRRAAREPERDRADDRAGGGRDGHGRQRGAHDGRSAGLGHRGAAGATRPTVEAARAVRARTRTGCRDHPRHLGHDAPRLGRVRAVPVPA